MNAKTCSRCGTSFQPKYPNSKLCYECYKKREDAFQMHTILSQQLTQAWEELGNIPESTMPTDILIDLVEVLDKVDTPKGEALYNYFAELLGKKTKQKGIPTKNKYTRPPTPDLFS